MRLFVVSVCLAAIGTASASASDAPSLFPVRATVWQRVTFATADENAVASEQKSAPPRVAAVEYSDAYKMRAKIHKYASYAMLPLFGTELLIGQSLYNNGGGGKRGAHLAVGTGIGVLFGVNTVTGAWNLWEARKDPNGRGRRVAHGLLMMAADAGFFATAATGPGHEGFERGQFEGGGGSKSTHRAIAVTSMGLATAGYLIMLFGGK
jgi:hypothetical protein